MRAPHPNTDYARRHLRFGWWSLFLYAGLGLVLETLQGFKVAAYLDVSNDTRRLLWTLAHAHGVGLALVHLVFALTVVGMPGFGGRHQRLISWSLIWASILLPGGFFAGGIIFYRGDPGLAVLLVPIGAGFFLAAVWLLARAANNLDRSEPPVPRPRKN